MRSQKREKPVCEDAQEKLSLAVKLSVCKCTKAGYYHFDVCKVLDVAGLTVQSVL
jgi:hypothetical protein